MQEDLRFASVERGLGVVLRSKTEAVLGDEAMKSAGSGQLVGADAVPTGTVKYSAGMLSHEKQQEKERRQR